MGNEEETSTCLCHDFYLPSASVELVTPLGIWYDHISYLTVRDKYENKKTQLKLVGEIIDKMIKWQLAHIFEMKISILPKMEHFLPFLVISLFFAVLSFGAQQSSWLYMQAWSLYAIWIYMLFEFIKWVKSSQYYTWYCMLHK